MADSLNSIGSIAAFLASVYADELTTGISGNLLLISDENCCCGSINSVIQFEQSRDDDDDVISGRITELGTIIIIIMQ